MKTNNESMKTNNESMKTNNELIQWLQENSSGYYRPSYDAAERLGSCLFVIREIMDALPERRDWLNPDLEKVAKEILSWDDNPPAETTTNQ